MRGILALPIQGSDESFRWGIWALISEKDYQRNAELLRNHEEDKATPFRGKLSGGIGFYKKSDMLDVTVHLRPGGKRPLFEVISDRHPLGIDQRQGITMDRVHAFIEMAIPGFFETE